MNQLQKKAKKDFGTICVTTFLLLLVFGFIVFLDIEGGIGHLPHTLGSISVVVGITLYAKLRAKEKDVENYLQFDEREFYMFRKSLDWGSYCFIAYLSAAVMTLFSLVGSRGTVPAWSLPLILLSSVFLSGTVQFLALMHYAKEDDMDSEGDAA